MSEPLQSKVSIIISSKFCLINLLAELNTNIKYKINLQYIIDESSLYILLIYVSLNNRHFDN